jgi:hypothetical protein
MGATTPTLLLSAFPKIFGTALPGAIPAVMSSNSSEAFMVKTTDKLQPFYLH